MSIIATCSFTGVNVWASFHISSYNLTARGKDFGKVGNAQMGDQSQAAVCFLKVFAKVLLIKYIIYILKVAYFVSYVKFLAPEPAAYLTAGQVKQHLWI